MKGIIVYGGAGFKPEFRGIMESRRAIPLESLKQWLKTFFNMK